MKDKKPHGFCETPEDKCTANYCDENGCQNRKRQYVEFEGKQHYYFESDVEDFKRLEGK